MPHLTRARATRSVLPVIGWLRSALRRLSPRARPIALVVLLLGAAVLALVVPAVYPPGWRWLSAGP